MASEEPEDYSKLPLDVKLTHKAGFSTLQQPSTQLLTIFFHAGVESQSYGL